MAAIARNKFKILSKNKKDEIMKEWNDKRKSSNGTLRLQLCKDLTVVQAALLCGWQIVAWTTGLHSLDPHEVALYGGFYSIQYLLLLGLRFLHYFLDGWNDVEMTPVVLGAAKTAVNASVNAVIRASVWGILAMATGFSAFNLRVLPLRSLTNIIISTSAIANYVILLHVGSAILEDCIRGGKDTATFRGDVPVDEKASRTFIGRIINSSSGIFGKMFAYLCKGLQLSLHFWPIGDSISLSCLVALVAFFSRRTLDIKWQTTEQVLRARDIAKETRRLIWPTTLLIMEYFFEVITTILKLTHEYALRFLISTSNIGKTDTLNEKSESELKEKVNDTDNLSDIEDTEKKKE